MSLLKLLFDRGLFINPKNQRNFFRTRFIFIFFTVTLRLPGCSLQLKLVSLHQMWLLLPWCILAIVV